MPRPKSVALKLSDLLNAEADRIALLAKDRQLTNDELDRIERMAKVNKTLCVPMDAEEKAKMAMNADELVDSLTPKDTLLFPRKGPKSTTSAYDPEPAPEKP